MLSLIRKIVGITAIYAIALNTILGVVMAPLPAAAGFDPFSVICHSGPDGAVEATPDAGGQPAKPSKACDHCTLCGTTPPPAAAVDNVVAGLLGPGTLMAVLRPADARSASNVVATSNLPRGPPLSA